MVARMVREGRLRHRQAIMGLGRMGRQVQLRQERVGQREPQHLPLHLHLMVVRQRPVPLVVLQERRLWRHLFQVRLKHH